MKTTTILAVAAPCLLGPWWGVGAGAKEPEAERTYRCAWEGTAVEFFKVSENKRALEIPDFICYRVKKQDFAMEVVQGTEEQRCEPLTTFVVQLEVRDAPEGRIEALRDAYVMGFNQACRPRDRGDGATPRAADGFSVKVSPIASPTVLEATITLYDYDDSFRDQLLESIRNLSTMIQARYEALAKYSADLSNVTGQYAKHLEGILKEVGEFNGHLGQLRVLEQSLADISKALQASLSACQQATDRRLASLAESVAADCSSLRARLQAIEAELAKVNKE